jgi:imidazolonepropionase
MSKIIIINAKALVQAGENLPRYKKGIDMQNLPIINNAFLEIENGIIVNYGSMNNWQNTVFEKVEVIDAKNKYVLPAFCDSHTHLVFAKYREEEFIDRIKGLSYEEIALKGGGILNSAKRLNELSEDELVQSALKRLELVQSFGTGAIEIKSGYGLTVEAELKILKVIKRLKEKSIIPIKTTFLGAHAFPLEFKNNHNAYIELIINEMLPVIEHEKLADYIDVFCERNYFSVEEMERILIAGKKYGLIPKVHVNQFSVLGGVSKAIELGALSVDHLEEISEDDILALKNSTCMPTLLPGCSHFISIPYANARKMINAGLPISLASDYNPGSTPNGNLQMVMSLACIKMKITPEEAINALTINAAYAMGLENECGSITKGKKARLIITKEIPSLAYIPYSFGENHIDQTIGF